MAIADWLEKVHQRPHEHRRRLMWVAAAGTIAVIGFFWVAAMKHELKVVFERAQTQPSVEQAFKESVADKAPSLTDTLRASVQDFLSIFKAPAPTAEGTPPAEAPVKQPAVPELKFLPD